MAVDFVIAVAATVVGAGLVYGLYWIAYRARAQQRATAGCWWLPAWRCFRIVIRNIDGADPITAIR